MNFGPRTSVVCEGVGVSSFEAVLFDWSGTLVHDPPPLDRLTSALRSIDRQLRAEHIATTLAAITAAAALPDVAEARRDEDTSNTRHRAANMLWFQRAGLDAELAEALYAFDADPANRPLYPDAAASLAAIHALGVKIAVVSDIHLDLRTLLAGQGVGEYVDAYVLSFEHGCQKPDPRMFLTALDLLDVAAATTLMVGDRCSHDGGAVDVGIATFILPPPPPVNGPRGLDAVTRLLAHE
jgi:HAD superfamily hydrolase (TIGR01549 family)